jgi:hypothetical protein
MSLAFSLNSGAYHLFVYFFYLKLVDMESDVLSEECLSEIDMHIV